MMGFTLSEKYALIGLDGMESLHSSTAKKAAVRGIAAAQLLERLLPEADRMGAPELAQRLEEGMRNVRKLSAERLRGLEREAGDALIQSGRMDMGPDLMASDITYYTAGVELKVWRCDKPLYEQLCQELRVFSDEKVTIDREAAAMLLLLRESGCIHEIFSAQEQNCLAQRMEAAGREEAVIASIWNCEFHSGLEGVAGAFLRGKRELFKNPYLEGVNLLCPFLDRRQAIFLDQAVLGTTVEQRRLAVMAFLSGRGHYVEEVKRGTETLVKIDNGLYQQWPGAFRSYKIPVTGVRLVPVYERE